MLRSRSTSPPCYHPCLCVSLYHDYSMSIIIALYRHEKNYDLSFDWKALYSYLSRYHLNDSTRSISIFASDSMAQHQRTLVKLIAKSRRYFVGGGTEVETGGFASPIPISEGSVGEEVLNTFIPFLSPFDNKYFASQVSIKETWVRV